MSDIIIFLWIILSLAVASIMGLLAKKYGSWIGISALAGLAVISNVLASAKIVKFPFGLHAPAGIIAYMLTFFLMDVLNEIYGKKEALKGAYAGIIAQLVTVPLIWLTLIWDAAPFMTKEKISAATIALGLSPRLFIVGLLSFFIGSMLNVYLFDMLRKATKGALLWLRSKVSTITGIFVSNIIFIPLGYYGTGVPIANMIKGHSLVQIMIALLDTFFVYFVVLALNKKIK